jgi:uncharacterized membrane protein
MKQIRLPAFCLLLLSAGFFSYVVSTARELPEKVAIHFNGAGQANGWMARTEHVGFSIITGLGVALVITLCFSLIRVLPSTMVNLPHRDYWLAPERKEMTVVWFQRQGLWMACISILFMGGMHFLILQANRVQPPVLAPVPGLVVTGVFMLATGLLTARMFFHFKKPAKS